MERTLLYNSMIGKAQKRLLFRLTYLLVALTLVAAVAGVAMLKMYRPFVPVEMLPGALSQDLVSIGAAVGLLVCLYAIARGSVRAWIAWLGFIGYLFYAYAIYSFDQLYTGFFLCYVAIVGLSIYAAIIFFRGMEIRMFESTDLRRSTTLHRVVAVFLLVLAAMFATSWIGLVLPAMEHADPPAGNSIIVLDLAFMLPLLVITALLLFKARPWGMLLAGFLLIKMGTLGLSVLIGELSMPAFGHDLNPPMIALFSLLGPVSIMLAMVWFRRMESLGVKTTI